MNFAPKRFCPYHALGFCLVLVLVGCSSRRPHFVNDPVGVGVLRDYLDLQSGYLIRVITPVLRSGGYQPQLREAPKENGVTVFTTTDDYVGYETSYYAVKGRFGGGIRVQFISAWVTKQNITTRRPYPVLRLFEFPDTSRFVRLIYTTRVSSADHDMAILAARDLPQLDHLTARFRTNPAGTCNVDLPKACEWVPKGIGVQTETRH